MSSFELKIKKKKMVKSVGLLNNTQCNAKAKMLRV